MVSLVVLGFLAKTNYAFAEYIVCPGKNRSFVMQSDTFEMPLGSNIEAGYAQGKFKHIKHKRVLESIIRKAKYEKYTVTNSRSHNLGLTSVSGSKTWGVTRSIFTGHWGGCQIIKPSKSTIAKLTKPVPVLKTPTKPKPVVKVPAKPVPVVKTPTNPTPVAKTPPQDKRTISASSGSGFAVSSDGYVITNNHVIEGCQDVVVHTKQKDIPMRVVTYDTQNDLALLKGDFTPSAVFSLSTSRPELLQDIYVAGYPFGINISTSVKVTKGIISSLTGIGNNFSNIQIDAALQSGNSGGPILDDMGNLVGVAVAKLDAKYMMANFGSIPENTNFGIKASVVRSLLDSSSVDIPAASTSPISKSQLGKIITAGTYYISCWMTVAQIDQVRSKKVLFTELD
jgi:S1-C subfamily serine protease